MTHPYFGQIDLTRGMRLAAVHIEHIGSTSVPGLAAKPIIDVLVTVGGRVVHDVRES